MAKQNTSTRDDAIARQALALSPPAKPLLMNLATLLILVAPLAVAVTGVLGGGAPGLSQATTAAAEFRITAPLHIRSGMIGEIRIRLSPVRAAAEPAIIIPDDDVRFRDGLETPVADGETVSIIPAVAGGC